MASKEYIFVVYNQTEDGEVEIVEAHISNANAKKAVKALESDGSSQVEVKKVELKKGVDDSGTATKKSKGKAATTSKASESKKAPKSPEMVVSDNEDEDEEGADEDAEEAPPKSKKGASKNSDDAKDAKKTIPEGKPNVLAGLNVLFTGTMTMDRATSKTTAEKYGAKVITKLEDTDYIILGTRPGDKKVKEIQDKDLDTISEDEFFEILKEGVPKEKRDRMAGEAKSAEPVTKKQKK